MAYIESFLLYLFVVAIIFLILMLPIVIIGWSLSYIEFFNKRKFFQFLFLKKTKFFKNQSEPYYNIYKILKSNAIVFLTIIYVTALSIFYINQSSNYYGKERAYPEAKAYKIVADVSAFFFETFVSSRNLYFKPNGSKYIKPYEQWQTYLLNKAFRYIPKNDGERAIWKYEYLYANYIRANTAPIDFKKLDAVNLKALLHVGGHPTIYKPSAQTMINDISEMLDLLLDGNIKDIAYKDVNRYAIASLYGVWIEDMKFLYYSLGELYNSDKRTEFINKSYSWTEDNRYLERIKKLSVLLDEVKEKINQDKALKGFFKSHKYIYPEMVGLRVALQAHLVYVDLLYKNFSCKMESLQKYLQYRKEFIKYAKTDKVYKNFNWMEKHSAEKLVKTHSGALAKYYLYKSCKITRDELKFKNKIKFEWTRTRNVVVKTNIILKRIEDE